MSRASDNLAGWRIVAAAATDIGCVRRRNEDACWIGPLHAPVFAAAVCDGIGGLSHGDQAAQLGCSCFARLAAALAPDRLSVEPVAQLVAEINRAVVEAATAAGDPQDMGATLAAFLAVPGADAAVIAHLGDSPILRIRDRSCVQLTMDHNLGSELRQLGILGPDQALRDKYAAELTRYLGMDEPPDCDAQATAVRPGDVFLLASDGLTAVVEPDEVPDIIEGRAPAAAVAELIRLVRERGAPDNVTVVDIRLVPLHE